jgi:hypothetical protein
MLGFNPGKSKDDEPSAPFPNDDDNNIIPVASTALLTEAYFTNSFIEHQFNKFDEADTKAHTSTGPSRELRDKPQELRTALRGLKRGDTQGFKKLINLLDAGAFFKQYIPVYQSIHDDIKKRVEADLAGPFHDILLSAQHGGSCGQAKEAVTGYGTHTPVVPLVLAMPVPAKPTSFFQHDLTQAPHAPPFFHPHFVNKQMQKIASVNKGLSAREADPPTHQWADEVKCKALERNLLSLKRDDLPGFEALISTLKKRSYGERNPIYEKAYRSILHDVKQYVKADQAGLYVDELKHQDELSKKLCCEGYANYCLSAVCCLWSIPYHASVVTWCCELACCDGNECIDPADREASCSRPCTSANLFWRRGRVSLEGFNDLRVGNRVDEDAATHVRADCSCKC